VIDYDSRLVDLYDGDNPDGPDHDFYRALADERVAQTILDIGCGTGILTVTFARRGRTVVGVDPSSSMLFYARTRPGGDAVTWILGDSRSLPETRFDFAVLTGNVVQHIPDPDWVRTLHDIRGRMSSGRTLAFESRNPSVRAWESWATHDRTSRDSPHGTLVEWADVTTVDEHTVELAAHNLFLRSGDTVTETVRLAFRPRVDIESDLRAAGFDVEAVYGDWKHTPFTEDAPVMVFVVRAR